MVREFARCQLDIFATRRTMEEDLAQARLDLIGRRRGTTMLLEAMLAHEALRPYAISTLRRLCTRMNANIAYTMLDNVWPSRMRCHGSTRPKINAVNQMEEQVKMSLEAIKLCGGSP